MTNIERSKLRNCYCDLWDTKPELYRRLGYPEGFCGLCEVCKKPGHTRHYPGPLPYTGTWCDECHEIEARHAASPAFGPLDEVLCMLLETWGRRYRFEMHRQERLLLLSKAPDNEVGAFGLPDGRIRVVYQASPGETSDEYCSVERAVRLIEALMAREKLGPVTLPPESGPQAKKSATAPAKRSWLARLFERM